MALDAVEGRVMRIDAGFDEGLRQGRLLGNENSMSDSTPMMSARSTFERLSTAGILSPWAARSNRSIARDR